MAKLHNSTPKADGFTLPGDLHKKAGCWLGWPERPDVWRNGGKNAQAMWVKICEAIATSDPVTVCASAQQFTNARAMLPAHIRVLEMTTNDAWFRDSGPAWLINPNTGETRGLDMQFNAYGGLHSGIYFPWDKDDQVAMKILEAERADRYRAPFIGEMGGIVGDGEGTLMTTEQTLLNDNRNAHLGKAQMTQHLCDYFGVDKVIWLPRGCKFDETDGHIDDLCRFSKPGHVYLAWTDDQSDPQYEIYKEAYDVLSATTDAKGRKLSITKLPSPQPQAWTEEYAQGLDKGEAAMAREPGLKVCASYVNSYIGNTAVIVPLFEQETDAEALRVYGELFPNHRIIGVPGTNEILLSGGNIGCITSPQYVA